MSVGSLNIELYFRQDSVYWGNLLKNLARLYFLLVNLFFSVILITDRIPGDYGHL